MKKSSVRQIEKFSEIYKNAEIDKNTIIFLDIDDTILTSTNDYGSAKHFTQMVKDEITKTDCTEFRAKIAVYERWIKSQSLVVTKLVDNDLPNFINNAIEKGAVVIGLTARQPSIAKVTVEQLKKHGINFNFNLSIKHKKAYNQQMHSNLKLCEQMKLYENCEAFLSDGIIFCHDLNKKGVVIKDFYNILKANINAKPNKFIFVDDGLHNIESLELFMKDLGIEEYYGYHIQSTNYLFDKNKARYIEKTDYHPKFRSRSISDFSIFKSLSYNN